MFELDGVRSARMVTFSKGMRQKMLIAAALLHAPDVIIFDEPLNGLDANAMLVFKELLRGLAAQGRTILFCSHLLDIVERLCPRIVIIDKGRAIAEGTPERDRTAHRTGDARAGVCRADGSPQRRGRHGGRAVLAGVARVTVLLARMLDVDPVQCRALVWASFISDMRQMKGSGLRLARAAAGSLGGALVSQLLYGGLCAALIVVPARRLRGQHDLLHVTAGDAGAGAARRLHRHRPLAGRPRATRAPSGRQPDVLRRQAHIGRRLLAPADGAVRLATGSGLSSRGTGWAAHRARQPRRCGDVRRARPGARHPAVPRPRAGDPRRAAAPVARVPAVQPVVRLRRWLRPALAYDPHAPGRSGSRRRRRRTSIPRHGSPPGSRSRSDARRPPTGLPRPRRCSCWRVGPAGAKSPVARLRRTTVDDVRRATRAAPLRVGRCRG